MRRPLIICAVIILAACSQQKTVETFSSVEKTATVNTGPSLPMPSKSLTLEDIDFSSYSEELAKFIQLEIGEESWAAIDKMRLYFAPEDGETILQTKTSTFDRPDGSVMIYTVSGLRDDSVHAQELFMIFEGAEDAQILAAYGVKIKCKRGVNTTQWQTELCI